MDAARIAAGAASVWRAIDGALSPIIGRGGVAALYKRSLYLARSEHACLADVYEAMSTPGEYVALQSALSQQTTVDAVAAVRGLLHTFHGLLTHLIGESLTERLLRSAWDNHSSGQAVQDIPS
ncbi:MAG TPA: hypothetical protein VGC19_14950 [Rhodanobacter sp.]